MPIEPNFAKERILRSIDALMTHIAEHGPEEASEADTLRYNTFSDLYRRIAVGDRLRGADLTLMNEALAFTARDRK